MLLGLRYFGLKLHITDGIYVEIRAVLAAVLLKKQYPPTVKALFYGRGKVYNIVYLGMKKEISKLPNLVFQTLVVLFLSLFSHFL